MEDFKQGPVIREPDVLLWKTGYVIIGIQTRHSDQTRVIAVDVMRTGQVLDIF